MASRWGDDIDEELKKEKRVHVGFVWNFLSMGEIIRRMEEETREWDETYPKSELNKIWGAVLVILPILISVSYSVLLIATIPFICLYAYVLVQIAKAWKRFHYSLVKYWGMTIPMLVLVLTLGFFVRKLIFG